MEYTYKKPESPEGLCPSHLLFLCGTLSVNHFRLPQAPEKEKRAEPAILSLILREAVCPLRRMDAGRPGRSPRRPAWNAGLRLQPRQRIGKLLINQIALVVDFAANEDRRRGSGFGVDDL